jgi:hypothetical protein
VDDVRLDIIGLNAIHGSQMPSISPYEVRVRAAARFNNEADARGLTREVESLYLNGPAGGCGVAFSIRENIAIVPALIAREHVSAGFSIEDA